MANIIHVLKAFVFSYPLKGEERLGRERFFSPGEHEVDDEVFNHPYIAKEFADGKIERPAQTLQRMQAVKEKEAEDLRQARIATAAAEAAFARLKAAEPKSTASVADIQAELNTPVGQLAKAQGGDITSTVRTLNLKGQKSA